MDYSKVLVPIDVSRDEMIKELLEQRNNLEGKLNMIRDEFIAVKEQIHAGANPTPLEIYRFINELLKRLESK